MSAITNWTYRSALLVKMETFVKRHFLLEVCVRNANEPQNTEASIFPD